MVESGGYCVCDVVECCCSGVLFFEAMLVVDDWEFVFDMFKDCFSKQLDIGESSEIGLYEVPSLRSLLGFGMGMILACFQICGRMFCCMARL